MSWYVIASIVLLILLLCIGVPVPYVFFGTTLFLMVTGGYDYSFLFPYSYSKIASMSCLTLPLFILAGGVIERGGIGERLINFINLFLGRLKGGLGVVMVVACALFGAISGSSLATETVMGSILCPRMKAAGYKEEDTAALLASCSLLGTFIPPSGLLILFAWTANVSVLACFLSTVLPGIILILMFSLWFILRYRKAANIVIPPKLSPKEKLKDVGQTTWVSIPALLFPIIILGGIYGGVMTPTEAAAVSVLYAIPVACFVYRKLKFKSLGPVFRDSLTSAGVVMLILFTVTMISRIYVVEDLPNMVLGLISKVSSKPLVVMMLINVFLVFLGLIMDDGSAMLLSTPILLPVAVAVGVDPVHYACIMATNLGLGCISPPCAPNLFLASRVAGVPLSKMLRPTFSFILFVWLPIIIVVTLFPQLALFLPRLILNYGA